MKVRHLLAFALLCVVPFVMAPAPPSYQLPGGGSAFNHQFSQDVDAQSHAVNNLSKIKLKQGQNTVEVAPPTLTGNRVLTLPDKTGDLCTLTDITPGNFTGTLPIAKGGTGKTSFTASRVLTSDGSGNVAEASTTTTQLGYLDVGSSLTTLLGAKVPTSGTASIATDITNDPAKTIKSRIRIPEVGGDNANYGEITMGDAGASNPTFALPTDVSSATLLGAANAQAVTNKDFGAGNKLTADLNANGKTLTGLKAGTPGSTEPPRMDQLADITTVVTVTNPPPMQADLNMTANATAHTVTGLKDGSGATDAVRMAQFKRSSGVFKGIPQAMLDVLDFEYPPKHRDFGMKEDYNSFAFAGGDLTPFFGAPTPQIPSLTVSSTTVSGSTTLTVDASGMARGMIISGAGIPAGTFITAIAGGNASLTMSKAATASSTATRSFIGREIIRFVTLTNNSTTATPQSNDTTDLVPGMFANSGSVTIASVTPGTSITLSTAWSGASGTYQWRFTPLWPNSQAFTMGSTSAPGLPVSGQYLFEQRIGNAPYATYCGVGESALKCILPVVVSSGIDWRTSGDIQTTMDGNGQAGDNATILSFEPVWLGTDEFSYVLAYAYGSDSAPVLTTAGAITGSDFAGFRMVCTFNGVDTSTGELYFVTQRGQTTGAGTLIASDLPCGWGSGLPEKQLKLGMEIHGNFTTGSGSATIECGGRYAAKCVTASKTLTGVASNSVAGTSFLMPNRLQASGYDSGTNRYYFHMSGVVLADGAPSVYNPVVGTSYLWIGNTMPRL